MAKFVDVAAELVAELDRESLGQLDFDRLRLKLMAVEAIGEIVGDRLRMQFGRGDVDRQDRIGTEECL
ncbi:hypothetical protein D3C72_2410260 [compost metagenome]